MMDLFGFKARKKAKEAKEKEINNLSRSETKELFMKYVGKLDAELLSDIIEDSIKMSHRYTMRILKLWH